MTVTQVAQGIQKHTAIVKQSGLGVPGSTGGAVLRRVTFIPQADRDTFENPELNTHEQSTGISYGLKKCSAKYSGVLSAGTFELIFAQILRKDFAATGAMVIGTDCVSSATAPQFVDGSAAFLTAGIKVGDVGRFTGFTTTAVANNSKNFLVTDLTAGNMTGVFLDGSAVLAKTETGSVTFTVVGKKSMPPLTGHTNDYFTAEDWYSDISKSEVFEDLKFNKADIALPSTGNATVDIDCIALSRSKGSVQILTTPTAETTTNVLTAVNGAVYIAGILIGDCTGITLSVDGSLTAGDAVLGSNSSNDINRGRIKVSGTFTGLYDSDTISAFYDAETPVSLIGVVTDNSADPLSDFVAFTMGRIKLTGDAPDDGEKQIVRTYPFTAEINKLGGAALAWDETIITIQDSAAA